MQLTGKELAWLFFVCEALALILRLANEIRKGIGKPTYIEARKRAGRSMDVHSAKYKWNSSNVILVRSLSSHTSVPQVLPFALWASQPYLLRSERNQARTKVPVISETRDEFLSLHSLFPINTCISVSWSKDSKTRGSCAQRAYKTLVGDGSIYENTLLP